MHTIRLCIDPGVKYIAYALGVNQTLNICGYYATHNNLSKAAFFASDYTRYLLYHSGYYMLESQTYIIVEYPQFEQKRNINHQNIIDLGIIAGSCCVIEQSKLVTPNDWKGSTPKEIHQPRIMEALTKPEKAIFDHYKTGAKSKDHNIIDAIGILLWAQRRLKR